MEHCVFDLASNDPVVHNYLVALYAQIKPDKLLTYLSMKGDDEETLPYDLKYALRICVDKDLEKACVHLYATMKLYEEAVDLALNIDVNLAKSIGNKPDLSDEIKKKLWLKIAKHIVTREKDIRQASLLLKDCNLLKIEDILPFFPDFNTIDHFKEAICSSLTEYNDTILILKDEMKDATNSAHEIREKLRVHRNRYTIVKTTDICFICDYPVLSRSFHVFNCGHKYHSECLRDEIRTHLKEAKRKRFDEIMTHLAKESYSHRSGIDSNLSLKEQYLDELDQLIASECLFCGEIMIKSIDEPFILPAELESEGWN